MQSTVNSASPNKCRRILKKACERILVTLTPREEMIVRLHFGIGRESRYTYRELAMQFSRTAGRIRQIRAEALRKLRQSFATLLTDTSHRSEAASRLGT